MQTIRDNSALFDGPDDDVWDRLKARAPKSAPVKTGLFRGSREQEDVDPPSRGPVVHHETVTQDIAPSGYYPWERFPVATVQPEARQRFRHGADTQSFDLLRTRLLQVLEANKLTSLAVTSPSPQCGATYTATNLALSLARLPSCRTLLVDLNFRSPGVANTLNLVPGDTLRKGLLGGLPLTGCLARFGANLMVGLADRAQPDPAELLMDPRTTRTLASLKEALKPDVIIYDVPPMLAYDDATALLPRVDGVLLVTDGTRTVAGQITQCQGILADQTQLLGVVLNKARRGGTARLRYGKT